MTPPPARSGLLAALLALVLVGGCRDAGDADAQREPRQHSPEPAAAMSADPGPSQDVAVIPVGPSRVLAAQMVGHLRLEVSGRRVPGRWQLTQSRRDVWVAGFFDEVGYSSPALWWGKGTTTHEVPGYRGGVAISQDARWIVWTRAVSGHYAPDPFSPRVMEVVDTATGRVRWSRPADADAPEIGALEVTNDGVVVFAHCLEPTRDIGGTAQCDDARIDVWVPGVGVAGLVPAAVTADHGPPGTVTALTPLVQVAGAHNGLLVRDTPSARPRYVHVSARGRVEEDATLPRRTVAVTADERFALLSTECTGRSTVCDWSVLSLDGGERRPLPSLADTIEDAGGAIATDIGWPTYPYVVERTDLLLVLDLGDYSLGPFPALARCSLAQARCVRVEG